VAGRLLGRDGVDAADGCGASNDAQAPDDVSWPFPAAAACFNAGVRLVRERNIKPA